MKKYAIQDVTDKQYYADNNQWSSSIEDALHFNNEDEAWEIAIVLNRDFSFTLTVIPIIY